jgi:hypothetical protein
VTESPAAGNAASEHERERSEALIVQAQDYARAESERADKLAALALKILNQCVALHPTGEDGYLDEWSMALQQLEDAAGEMSPPDGDPLEDACQAGIKAERERLGAVISPDQFRKLADWFDTDDEFKTTMFPETWPPGSRAPEVQSDLRRFADLLEGDRD